MLEVEFSKISEKFLEKCNNVLYERIIKKIKELAKNPFPADSKRVINRKEKVFRVRVGDYRMIYMVINEKNILFISEIGKRDKIYN